MVKNKEFGRMVAWKGQDVASVPLLDAIKDYNTVDPNSFTVKAAKKIGISFGD